MKDETLFRIAETFGPPFIRAIGTSTRMTVKGKDNFDKALESGPLLFSCFHGRMFYLIFHVRDKNVSALVSQSKDGTLITRVIKRLGIDSVRSMAFA